MDVTYAAIVGEGKAKVKFFEVWVCFEIWGQLRPQMSGVRHIPAGQAPPAGSREAPERVANTDSSWTSRS